MEYDNEMRGVLFKNDRKEKETHPDYKGHCQIGGQKHWISAWLKDGAKGKFFSFSFTAADGAGGSGTKSGTSGQRPAPSARPKPTEQQLANQADNDIPDVPF